MSSVHAESVYTHAHLQPQVSKPTKEKVIVGLFMAVNSTKHFCL